MRVVVPQRAVHVLLPLFVIYMMGLLMIFDASSGEMMEMASEKNLFSGCIRQFLWGIIAVVFLLLTFRVGWEKIYQHIDVLYWICTLLLLFVFVPKIGISANGARRWIGIGSFRIQPSEFMKIILPAYFIRQCLLDQKLYSSFSAFWCLIGKITIPIALIALEPNNGTAGVIVIMVAILTLLVGIPLRFYLVPLCCIGIGLVVFASTNSHVQKRLTTYLHPEHDILGKGHQPYQAKIAAGSGGLFGKGPARSLQKLSYLPEAQNDYIAAIYAEEFGFFGIFALLLGYSWAIYEALCIIYAFEMMAPFCWAMGIVYLLAFQTFMNLGVVSGLLPSTGLNLPFFSQGGSSLVANSVGVGLILSMMRKNEPVESL